MVAKIVENAGHRSIQRLALGVVVLLVTLINVYPVAATMAMTGPSPLPPNIGIDMYLYLNLSNLNSPSAGVYTNPWYGNEVPGSQLNHVKFGLAIQFYRAILLLTQHSFWIANFVWYMLVSAAIALSCLWFFRTVFPSMSVSGLAFAVCIFMFVDVTEIPSLPRRFIDLLLGRGADFGPLVYSRMFFPQSVIPLMLLFLGLGVIGLRTKNIYLWLGMVLVQLLSLLIYPYAMPVLVGACLIACTLVWIMEIPRGKVALSSWGNVGLFLILSVLVDLAVLWTNGAFSGGLVGHNVSAIRIAFSELLYDFGFSIPALLILAVAVIVLGRRGYIPGAVMCAGVGVSLFLLHFSDVVFTPLLVISGHINALVGFGLAILVSWLALYFYSIYVSRFPLLRRGMVALVIFVLLYGALLAQTQFESFKELNLTASGLAKKIQTLNLEKSDLVIAPVARADDVSAWIPLISNARVLFTRNAEYILNPGDPVIQVERRTKQLYFMGKDPGYLTQALDVNNNDFDEQLNLVLMSEIAMRDRPEWAQILSSTRDILTRELAKIEQHPDEMDTFLRDYNRIVVIDQIMNPIFSRETLLEHMKPEMELEGAGYRIWVATPLSRQ